MNISYTHKISRESCHPAAKNCKNLRQFKSTIRRRFSKKVSPATHCCSYSHSNGFSELLIYTTQEHSRKHKFLKLSQCKQKSQLDLEGLRSTGTTSKSLKIHFQSNYHKKHGGQLHCGVFFIKIKGKFKELYLLAPSGALVVIMVY